MNMRIIRVGIAFITLFALTAGGLAGTAAAQENVASDCGEAHGIHNVVGLGPGAQFGQAVADHAQNIETLGPPGEIATALCNPEAE